MTYRALGSRQSQEMQVIEDHGMMQSLGLIAYTRLNQHYREVFEEKVTPLVLDIEEEPEDQDHVHHGDHDDNNHAAVQGHGGQDHPP